MVDYWSCNRLLRHVGDSITHGGQLWQHVKLKLKVWVGIAVEHCLGALNAESLDALIKTAPITRVLLAIVNVAIVEVN